MVLLSNMQRFIDLEKEIKPSQTFCLSVLHPRTMKQADLNSVSSIFLEPTGGNDLETMRRVDFALLKVSRFC